jgi:hypothetical protein
MVAILKLFPTSAEQQKKTAKPELRGHAIAKLKTLHAEAEETARLANILGRSMYAGMTLPILCVLTIGLSVEVSAAPQLLWCGFVCAVSIAILAAYRHAMRQPFERESLKTFAKDLSAILLFAGFAWGSGAFLALPVGTPAVAALTFTAVPALAIAYLLRDRAALMLFLAPTTLLSAAACLLKPYAGGIWLSLSTLVLGAAIAGAAALYERLTGTQSKPAMLSLP